MENKFVEPAAEKKYHFFNILHEEEERNRGLLRPRENSRIKEEGSSSQEKFAAARAVPREVMSFSSPFPFFWNSMKYFNVSGSSCCMTIPIKFAREHLAAEVKNPDGVDVLLQNEEGLSWEVRLKPAGQKYMFFAGWKGFATDNKLKIGDCVIFELVDRLPDSTFAMNFQICRIIRPQEECFRENSTIRKGGPDNDDKFASAMAVERKTSLLQQWQSREKIYRFHFPDNISQLKVGRKNGTCLAAKCRRPQLVAWCQLIWM